MITSLLLVESYSNYRIVADRTAGFDSDWENKGLWQNNKLLG